MKAKIQNVSRAFLASIFITVSASALAGVTFELGGEAKTLSPAKSYPFGEHLNQRLFYKVSACERTVITSPSPNGMYSNTANGLVSSILAAYSSHVPLALRPDDIWLALTGAFGLYVDRHAEEMRDVFVAHQGKIQLTVRATTPIGLENVNEASWRELVQKMSVAIDKNLKQEVKDWLLPNFSTTTPIDTMAGGILLMGTMQNYMAYKMVLCCGIPRVTLEGTLEDWQLLREKAARFATFGGDLEKWATLLLPVLDQLIASYQGDVDIAFWERIATQQRKGSGGEIDLSGWLLVFAPFNEQGKYHLLPANEVASTHAYGKVFYKNLPDSGRTVPVVVEDHSHQSGGGTYNTIFYGGVVQPEYDAATNTIRPVVGWAILTNDPEKAKANAGEPIYD